MDTRSPGKVRDGRLQVVTTTLPERGRTRIGVDLLAFTDNRVLCPPKQRQTGLAARQYNGRGKAGREVGQRIASRVWAGIDRHLWPRH